MKNCLLWLTAAIYLVAGVYSPLMANSLRTVALTGDPAPGRPSGTKFGHFPTHVALNAAGRVAFVGHTNVDDSALGLWSNGSGALALVAFDGDQAPGMPEGTRFFALGGTDSFSGFVLNNAGELTFNSQISRGGFHGVWGERSGSLSLIVSDGATVPVMPDGEELPIINDFYFNSAGDTLFLASNSCAIFSQCRSAVFSSRSGALTLVASQYAQAPGYPADVTLFIRTDDIIHNSAGHIAFPATLMGSPAFGAGVWSNRSGYLEPLAITGDLAPGTSANFFGMFRPAMSSNGTIAFWASLYPVPVNDGGTEADTGLWSDRKGVLTLIAREGAQPPGMQSGVRFGNFLFNAQISLNSLGHTAFRATVVGSGINAGNDHGIWSEGFGSLTLVAREGERAPETPAGVIFKDLHVAGLNPIGQMVLTAEVAGPSVNSTNDIGLWAQDRAGILRLIAREGELIEVGVGDFRTVRLISSGGFNARGQLAFSAYFTDNTSGIFVSNLVAVPEPSLWTMLCAACASSMLVRVKGRVAKIQLDIASPRYGANSA